MLESCDSCLCTTTIADAKGEIRTSRPSPVWKICFRLKDTRLWEELARSNAGQRNKNGKATGWPRTSPRRRTAHLRYWIGCSGAMRCSSEAASSIMVHTILWMSRNLLSELLAVDTRTSSRVTSLAPQRRMSSCDLDSLCREIKHPPQPYHTLFYQQLALSFDLRKGHERDEQAYKDVSSSLRLLALPTSGLSASLSR